MPRVTPRQIYDALVQHLNVTSDEELARELRVPLRTLQRFKSEKVTNFNFERTVDWLDRVGWLQTDPDAKQAADREGVSRAIEDVSRAIDQASDVLKRLLDRVAEQETPRDAVEENGP